MALSLAYLLSKTKTLHLRKLLGYWELQELSLEICVSYLNKVSVLPVSLDAVDSRKWRIAQVWHTRFKWIYSKAVTILLQFCCSLSLTPQLSYSPVRAPLPLIQSKFLLSLMRIGGSWWQWMVVGGIWHSRQQLQALTCSWRNIVSLMAAGAADGVWEIWC